MNAKPYLFNPTAIGLSFVGVMAIASLGALTYEAKTLTPKQQYNVNIKPAAAGVQSLSLTSNTTGTAVIKLDEFRIYVSFDFVPHPDSYGVPGSEFTAIEITHLAVNKIVDVNGNEFDDFTDYNDHRNINLLLSDFIEKNKLVEAV